MWFLTLRPIKLFLSDAKNHSGSYRLKPQVTVLFYPLDAAYKQAVEVLERARSSWETDMEEACEVTIFQF